jgi:hypothetical protein
MKRYISTLVLASIVMLLQAQEVMKVELNEGKTVEYKVSDIKRVFFDTKTEDEDDIETTSAVLFVGDKKTIIGTVTTSESLNDFVASVDGNVIKANHVGATAIIVNDKHLIVVLVLSLYNSIDDPVLEWGMPKDTIKAKQKQGTIYQEKDTILLYKDCGDATGIAYSFNKEDKLQMVLVLVPSKKGTSFMYYLLERFFIYPEKLNDGTYWGFDAYDPTKANTVIYYTPSGSTHQCIYVPATRVFGNNSIRRRSAKESDMDQEIIAKIKEFYQFEIKKDE